MFIKNYTSLEKNLIKYLIQLKKEVSVMAKDKKAFVLYADLIHTLEKLPDDKAGLLFKHILSYVNDENPVTDDLIVEISFEPIKQQLKRDLMKYKSVCDRNKINGAKGGRPKKQEEPKKPNGLSGNPNKPKKPDTGTDSDRDTDSDKDKEKYNYKTSFLSELKNSDVPNSEHLEIALAFQKLFKSNLNELGIQNTTIDKAKGKWVDSIRLMIELDGRTKDELLEIFDFLKKDDFWRKNILSTSKLREKFEQLLIKSRSNEKAKSGNGQGASYEEIGNILNEEFGHLPN